MKKSKQSLVLHHPFRFILALITAIMIVGGLTHVLVPQIERAAIGVALIFVAIRCVVGSLTVNYMWSTHYYLADILGTIAQRARDEGFAMRPTIAAGDCNLLLSILNVFALAALGANFWTQVYVFNPGLLGGLVMLTSCVLYTILYYATRYFVVRRIVHKSWVAKAAPVR